MVGPGVMIAVKCWHNLSLFIYTDLTIKLFHWMSLLAELYIDASHQYLMLLSFNVFQIFCFFFPKCIHRVNHFLNIVNDMNVVFLITTFEKVRNWTAIMRNFTWVTYTCSDQFQTMRIRRKYRIRVVGLVKIFAKLAELPTKKIIMWKELENELFRSVLQKTCSKCSAYFQPRS